MVNGWVFQASVRHEMYLMHYEQSGKPSEDLRKCLLYASARLSLVGVPIPLAFAFHFEYKRALFDK